MKHLPLFVFLSAGSLAAQVTATISSQGTQVISQTTGYSPKSAVLARIDVCNQAAEDANIAVSRVSSSVILAEQYSLYGSDVVDAVLAALQQKDLFTRAQKAVASGANAAILLTALFKTWTPFTVAVIQAAPAIAAAILPAVGDPRDLAVLSKKIMQDNTTFVLGKKGSGNDCHTGLAVAMTPAVNIDQIAIQ